MMVGISGHAILDGTNLKDPHGTQVCFIFLPFGRLIHLLVTHSLCIDLVRRYCLVPVCLIAVGQMQIGPWAVNKCGVALTTQ